MCFGQVSVFRSFGKEHESVEMSLIDSLKADTSYIFFSSEVLLYWLNKGKGRTNERAE